MILQSGTSLQSAAVGFRLGPVNAPSVAVSVKMMRFTPQLRHFHCELQRIDFARFDPAAHGNFAVLGVDSDHDFLRAEFFDETLCDFRILTGDRPENHAGNTGIEKKFRILFGTDSAADFAGDVHAFANPANRFHIDGMPRLGSVEVHKVNDFRSVVHPFDRLFRRIVAVDGLSGIISLKKTDHSVRRAYR